MTFGYGLAVFLHFCQSDLDSRELRAILSKYFDNDRLIATSDATISLRISGEFDDPGAENVLAKEISFVAPGRPAV